MHEPKSSFGPLAAKTSLRSGNGERAADSSSRFHKATATPATALERPLTLSPTASAKPQVCGMRNRPTRLAGQCPERNLPPPNANLTTSAVVTPQVTAIAPDLRSADL